MYIVPIRFDTVMHHETDLAQGQVSRAADDAMSNILPDSTCNPSTT
jgi:hypothetical protein